MQKQFIMETPIEGEVIESVYTATSHARNNNHYLRLNQEDLRYQRYRRAEDVDYWRKRSGWFDDDEAMREYNSGVYDAYYSGEGGGGGGSGGGGARSGLRSAATSEMAKNFLKVLSVLVAFGLFVLLVRVIMRRMSDSQEKKKKRSTSSGRGERSKSRSRSRSRSRKASCSGDAYDLMDDNNDDDEGKSKRSSRSKSKTRSRSRSRSRARSRSRSRTEKTSSAVAATAQDPVLV
jgi:preprotein translocase subunit SecG